MRTLFDTLRRVAANLRFGFCRLTEIQYSAPWQRGSSRCG